MKKNEMILYFIFVLSVFMIPNKALAEQGIQKYDEIITGLYPAVDIGKDSNNNYYAVGDGQFVKLDVYRNLIFKKDLQETYTDIYDCDSVDFDSENNVYLMCKKKVIFLDSHVTVSTTTNAYPHAALVKLNPEGEVIFIKDYSNQYDYEEANEIRIYGDYIYYVSRKYELGDYTGTSDHYAHYNYVGKRYLAKLDLNGNEIWKKRIGTKEANVELSWYTSTGAGSGWGSIQEKNISILVVDNYLYVNGIPLDGEMYFAKYDLDGNKIWERELGSIANDITDLTETYDGNFMAVGKIYSNDIPGISYTGTDTNPIIIKYSPSGEILSYKIFDGEGLGVALKKADGGYYAILDLEVENVPEINNENANPYLVKMDDELNVIDTKELEFRAMGLYVLEEDGVYAIDGWEKISYYSNEQEKTINDNLLLNKNHVTPLSKIFKNTTLDTSKPLDWEVENDEIVKIEDKTIVPVSIGETTISTTKGLNHYVLRVEVTDQEVPVIDDIPGETINAVVIENPKTYNSIIMIILVLILTICFLTVYYRKKES